MTRSMDATQWDELKRVVGEALELDEDERDTFIELNCSTDVLRAEARSLIRAAAASDCDTVMLDRRADAFMGLRPQDPKGLLGKRLGRFTIQRQVGRGATGAVFVAKQDGFEREVALKVFPPHALGFDTHLRFRREIGALGRIEHPGVARVYDAGLEADGSGFAAATPFIAMELVDGLPITQHCDEHELSLRDRVALLADVADAVHAAHQRAVIHRDLKPANILVTRPDKEHPHGTPKVLDFGIARLLDDASGDTYERTTAGVVLGSLAYMAPEQARGEAGNIDVRTDVYALGALLHELATGAPPVDLSGKPIHAALAMLADPPEPRPHIHDDFSGGDLTTVIRTALATENERRYESAAALAGDLRRVLRGMPIEAAPPSAAYRFRKFAKRNAVGIGIGAALLVALTVATAVSSVSLIREREARREADEQRSLAVERERAEAEQRQRAEATSDFLTHLVWSADPGEIGRDATVIEAVRSALPSLSSYAEGDKVAESILHRTVGQTFRNLGYPEEADAAFTEAARLAEEALGPSSELALACRLEHAGSLISRYQIEPARELIDRASADLESMPPGDARRRIEHMHLLERASLTTEDGESTLGVELFEQALTQAAAEPGLIDEYNLDVARSNYGLALSYAGRMQDAERVIRQVADGRAQRLGDSHPRTLIQKQHLAAALVELGRFDEAADLLDRVIRDGTAAWGDTHPHILAARHGVATLELTRGNYDRAAEIAATVLSDARMALGDDDPYLLYPANTRAVSLAQLERWDDAVPAMRELFEIGGNLYGPEHPITLSLRANLASVLARTGDAEAAIRELRPTLDAQRLTLGIDATNTLVTQHGLARALTDTGELDESLRLLRDGIAKAEQAGVTPIIPHYRRSLGKALAKAGDIASAEQTLLQAFDEAESLLSETEARRAAEAVAEFYEQQSRQDAAEKWQARAAGATPAE